MFLQRLTESVFLWRRHLWVKRLLLKLDESPGLSELGCDRNDQWPRVLVSWSSCACRDHITLSLVDVSFDARSGQGVVKYLNPFIRPTSNISTDFSLAKTPTKTAATLHIMLERRATFTAFGWSHCDVSLRFSRRLLAAGTRHLLAGRRQASVSTGGLKLV